MNTEDAKLSTEKRNKLPGKSFCGPGRSFPVPDKAHVTAARRLIGRAKVSPATKSKILACVNRKAKALGMKDAEENTEQEVERVLNSVDYASTHAAVKWLEELYAEEGSKSKDNDTKPVDLL